MHPFHYRLFGFLIESEIELPELARCDGSPADIAISLAAKPGGMGYRLDIAEVATFEIEGGDEIRVCPVPGVDPRNVRLYLLGSAMGALLHQRGLLPLHANAVDVDGRSFAFMGHSGAGKSTLAAWFHDHGYPILADDVCLVEAIGSVPVAYPGLPRLRLWQDALDASGRSSADHSPSFIEEVDAGEPVKYDVMVDPATLALTPLPLGGIFLLERGEREEIVRLDGMDCVEALSVNTYRGHLVGEVGGVFDHMNSCVNVASKVPVFRWTRPFRRDLFDAQALSMLDFCRKLPLAGG